LAFSYNSGVDDTISRLSALSSGATTLEQLSYLGLDTVVQRSHPGAGPVLIDDPAESVQTVVLVAGVCAAHGKVDVSVLPMGRLM
jgi:hypothetical protein